MNRNSHFPTAGISRGFSLLEVLTVISIIGVLGSIGAYVTSDLREASTRAKLQSEAQTLNSAVLAYLGSNGKLSSSLTVDEVVAKLKTVADADSAKGANGLRGGFLDRRAEIVLQTAAEGASDSARLYWEKPKLRFRYATDGPPGIKGFRLNDAGGSAAPVTEKREGMFDLAKSDTWIWDYVEQPVSFADGPSQIATTFISEEEEPEAITVVAPTPPETNPNPAPVLLLAPELSRPGGNYPIDDYNLSLSLTNPNPLGSSELFYSTDYSPWIAYTGSISLAPDSVLRVQATPIDDTKFLASPIAQGIYSIGEAKLNPPQILPNFDSFGFFTGNDVLVLLADSNNPGISRVQFRVAGGPWTDFVDPFVLLKEDFPSGVSVEGRALPLTDVNYQPSAVNYRFIPANALNFAGTTSGRFYNPVGPEAMVTNLQGTDADSYFEWGSATGADRSESWLDLNGTGFGNIINGERFHIGDLGYYNGTIDSGTGADSIFLDITLSLDVNGTIFNPYFDFEFNLINTENSDDEWDSADYVLLEDSTASRTLVFNGFEFEFELEFGQATENGFAEFDEFHVLENLDASVNLYGSLNLIKSPKGFGHLDGPIISDTDFGQSEIEIYQNIGYRDPAELVEILEQQAKIDLKAAKDGNHIATDESDNTLDAVDEFIVTIDKDQFDQAEALVEIALLATTTSKKAANDAEVALGKLEQAVEQAESALTLKPELAGDVEKIIDMRDDAIAFASEARTAADLASAAAEYVTALWADAQAEALSGASKKYAQYLSNVAALEAENAGDAPGEVQKSLTDVQKDALDVNLILADLDYGKIEKLIGDINAELANAAAELAKGTDAASRARQAANEAASIAAVEPKAANSASKASDSADLADSFIADAQAVNDTLLDFASDVLADLNEAMTKGPAKHPFEYADYLLDLVKEAGKVVKERFDLVEDAHKEAEKAAEDAMDYIDDDDLTSAGIALDLAKEFASVAAQVVPAVEVEAPKVRPLAEVVGAHAAEHPVAAGAYADALKEANKAEGLPGEARALAAEAASLAAEAERYIADSIR